MAIEFKQSNEKPKDLRSIVDPSRAQVVAGAGRHERKIAENMLNEGDHERYAPGYIESAHEHEVMAGKRHDYELVIRAVKSVEELRAIQDNIVNEMEKGETQYTLDELMEFNMMRKVINDEFHRRLVESGAMLG